MRSASKEGGRTLARGKYHITVGEDKANLVLSKFGGSGDARLWIAIMNAVNEAVIAERDACAQIAREDAEAERGHRAEAADMADAIAEQISSRDTAVEKL